MLAFQDLGSILAGYGIVLGATAVYALALVARGRRLARQPPDEDKKWE
jgi:hypothetical protein